MPQPAGSPSTKGDTPVLADHAQLRSARPRAWLQVLPSTIGCGQLCIKRLVAGAALHHSVASLLVQRRIGQGGDEHRLLGFQGLNLSRQALQLALFPESEFLAALGRRNYGRASNRRDT